VDGAEGEWILMDEVLVVVVYAFFGALMRILWGMWKAEDSILNVKLSGRRIVFEFLISIGFGIFGGQLVTDLGIVKFGINISTLISSLIGPNVIETIAKKFTFTKKMEVIVSDQQINASNLNFREMNALEFLKENGRITNSIYQRLNRTTHDVAKHELDLLVSIKKLKRKGSNKLTYYILV